MCGIAGIINHQAEAGVEKTLRAMTGTLLHRGPDGEGFFIDADAALGHRRLSIIDVAGGAQPLYSEDERVVLIFNGEIYNYRKLSDELKARGHHFRTRSDGEVLLHLYEELGNECLREFDGMFAFALYDAKKRSVLLARDRMGQKPLCYFLHGKTLVFGSELSALKEHPAMPRELDPGAVGDFFSLQYIPGSATIYLGVHKLPPGHFMEFRLDDASARIASYWNVDYSLKSEHGDFAACAAEFRELFERAVEKRLMSEVPFGVFLSGGIDSAAVAAVAAAKCGSSGIDAFTVGFADPAYDERARARKTAAAINALSGCRLRHFEQEINPCDFSLLSELVSHFGEPFADASMLPTALLSRFARNRITVALSGDGADELFAGYERYIAMRLARQSAVLPRHLRRGFFLGAARLLPDGGERSLAGRLRRLCLLLGDTSNDGYFNLLDRCPGSLRREIFGEPLTEAVRRDTGELFRGGSAWTPGAADPIERLSEIDLRTYLPGDILPKVDIASMSSGLEVRSPFLDREIVEFSSRIPQQFKLAGNCRKRIVREAFKHLLPPGTLAAPKKGFGVPVGHWLRNEWKQLAREAIFDGIPCQEGYLRAEPLEKLWQAHQTGKRDCSYLFWSILIFSLFMQKEKGRHS